MILQLILKHKAVKFISEHWRIIVSIGAVLILIALAVQSYRHAYKRGEEACEGKYEQLIHDQNQKAQFLISQMEKKYDSASRQIRSIPSNGCVGRASSVVNDRLRENFNPSQ